MHRRRHPQRHPASAPAAGDGDSPRDHALVPPSRNVTRTASATSDSFVQQMEAAGLATPADATSSESSSDADGQARLYQAVRRAILREHADVRAHVTHSLADFLASRLIACPFACSCIPLE